jgi:hypothetical protein
MSAAVLPFRKKFDPDSPEAEESYEQVVQRMNWLNTTLRSTRLRYEELERQFVENDLLARSGARRGQPLTPRGRRTRLDELFNCKETLANKELEYGLLRHELQAMNRDLEQWAQARRQGQIQEC